MVEPADGLRQLLLKSGIDPESDCGKQMLAYLALLQKWNCTINLTSTTDWTGIFPLFQEAICASSLYPDGAASHLDIGSGGGFPAIPLRIRRPQVRLEMVESRMKRCVFLETVAQSLGFAETPVHNMRLNVFLKSTNRDKVWDCISWKALKLSSNDLKGLREHAHPKTQFWVFHGKGLPVENPEIFRTNFRLMRQERIESDKEWYLSIYCSANG